MKDKSFFVMIQVTKLGVAKSSMILANVYLIIITNSLAVLATIMKDYFSRFLCTWFTHQWFSNKGKWFPGDIYVLKQMICCNRNLINLQCLLITSSFLAVYANLFLISVL